ncbi:MAG: type II toxin-antitoxin system HicB family antitoxin [Ignavibacteria bacterium]|jgi:predicted RNase H-like HicB family nuclease|nr:type II toxin-antitoxin system HicB family antitoxin [Ignavibacteria bacterium]
MKKFSVVIEKCKETGLFVGYVPGFRGASSQGSTIDELKDNLRIAINMLLEYGTPVFESEYVDTQDLVFT